LKNTGEAKNFVILSENGIAKGIRRIIAWTGPETKQAYEAAEHFSQRLKYLTTKKDQDISKEIAALVTDLDILAIPAVSKPVFQKEIDLLIASQAAHKKNLTQGAVGRAEELAKQLAESKLSIFVDELDVGNDRKALSNAVQVFRDTAPACAVALFARDAKQVTVMAVVPKSLNDRLSAAEWVKEVGAVLGGKGGGKPDTAQASGPDVNKFNEAIERARTYADERLK